jgi:hypothetical protein
LRVLNSADVVKGTRARVVRAIEELGKVATSDAEIVNDSNLYCAINPVRRRRALRSERMGATFGINLRQPSAST